MEILNKNLRRKIIEKGCEFKLGHFGAALSCVDCISCLYDKVLKAEDIFILSKGHGAPALYSKLEDLGKNVTWRVHPELDEKNGIHATTGSLGHGLPIAIGRAYAKKLKGDKGKVYVLVGDGEIQEGSNWEALMIANKLKISINILIDWNKYSATDSVKNTLNLDAEDLSRKLEAFGCKTIIINGHDEKELEKINELGEGINAIILDTVKGKGVKILEQSHDHVYYWNLNSEEYKKALEDLKSSPGEQVTIEKTNLKGVYLLKPGLFTDNRGSYCELYNKKINFDVMNESGIPEIEFLTDCISVSKKDVLKGFHGDLKTWKLTTCLKGKVYSVILNCDESSEDFGKWEAFTLSDENRYQLLIPPKFGNSFLVLSDEAVYYYKQSTYYNPKELPQFTYKWNDQRFNIKWPITNPILSERDK